MGTMHNIWIVPSPYDPLQVEVERFDFVGDLFYKSGSLAAIQSTVIVGEAQSDMRYKCVNAAANIFRTRNYCVDTQDCHLRQIDHRGKDLYAVVAQV